MIEATEHTLVETLGTLGIITMNRPAALNAASNEMVVRMTAALDDFARDGRIATVSIRGAGSRAFCAGGDVRVFSPIPPGPKLEQMGRMVFGAEYRLAYRINRCKKPIVALIDGIALGFGCGIAMNSSHRVTTERTILAMPEVALGLFPDVGASWFFNRLPGEMGVYLALTGTRLNAADAMALGMGTNHVRAESVAALIDELAASGSVGETLQRFEGPPGESAIATRQARVDALFAGGTVEAICAALETAPEPWAGEALASIRRASPTSLKITLREIRQARGRAIEDCLSTEYRLAVRIVPQPDFREGVRAILIDKDNAPRWQPDRLDAVELQAIDAYFQPLAPREPELDLS